MVGMGYQLSPLDKVNSAETITGRAVTSAEPNHSTALRWVEERAILLVEIMVVVCNVFEALARTLAKRYRPDT